MPCAKAACEKVPPSVEQGSEALSFEALGAGASRDLGSERGYVHHPSKPKHLPLPGTPVNRVRLPKDGRQELQAGGEGPRYQQRLQQHSRGRKDTFVTVQERGME